MKVPDNFVINKTVAGTNKSTLVRKEKTAIKAIRNVATINKF